MSFGEKRKQQKNDNCREINTEEEIMELQVEQRIRKEDSIVRIGDKMNKNIQTEKNRKSKNRNNNKIEEHKKE